MSMMKKWEIGYMFMLETHKDMKRLICFKQEVKTGNHQAIEYMGPEQIREMSLLVTVDLLVVGRSTRWMCPVRRDVDKIFKPELRNVCCEKLGNKVY